MKKYFKLIIVIIFIGICNSCILTNINNKNMFIEIQLKDSIGNIIFSKDSLYNKLLLVESMMPSKYGHYYSDEKDKYLVNHNYDGPIALFGSNSYESRDSKYLFNVPINCTINDTAYIKFKLMDNFKYKIKKYPFKVNDTLKIILNLSESDIDSSHVK